SYSDGRRRAFVVEGTTSILGATDLPRTDDSRARLLAALVASPGATQGELATRAGLSLPLANRHLRVLERVGLVTSTKTWRTRTYQFPTASGGQTSPMEQMARNTLSSVSLRGTSIE
ncbi:MAG TPA: winged helix-turn-helix domain-containing protein, partial [Candidatus Thermoplasmatota archaeon]